MKMSLFKSAITSSMIFFSSSVYAVSGLMLSAKKESCERLQGYSPLVKSNLTFSIRAATEAKESIKEIHNKLSSESKKLLIKTQKNTKAMHEIRATISRLTADIVNSQQIIEKLRSKRSLTADEKVSFENAQFAIKKAKSTIETKSYDLRKLSAWNKSLFEQIEKRDGDLLRALTMNQRHAAIFGHKALSLEKELSNIYKEMSDVCK